MVVFYYCIAARKRLPRTFDDGNQMAISGGRHIACRLCFRGQIETLRVSYLPGRELISLVLVEHGVHAEMRAETKNSKLQLLIRVISCMIANALSSRVSKRAFLTQ